MGGVLAWGSESGLGVRQANLELNSTAITSELYTKFSDLFKLSSLIHKVGDNTTNFVRLLGRLNDNVCKGPCQVPGADKAFNKNVKSLILECIIQIVFLEIVLLIRCL